MLQKLIKAFFLSFFFFVVMFCNSKLENPFTEICEFKLFCLRLMISFKIDKENITLVINQLEKIKNDDKFRL